VNHRTRWPVRVFWIPGLVALCAAGCSDSPSDPLAAITTVETVPSLAISAHLPAVTELADRLPPSEVLDRAVADWEASWDREDGELVRSQARQEVVPILHDLLGESATRTALQTLEWLRETPDLAERLPPALGQPVADALALMTRAEEALASGDGELSLELALEASDEVRSVTPEAVARRLIARGRTLIESDDWSLGDQQRALHLLNGAQRALAREDFSRAIQRAFYACQVMQGVPEALDPAGPGPDAPDDEPVKGGAESGVAAG
jgi:hypothetical protein